MSPNNELTPIDKAVWLQFAFADDINSVGEAASVLRKQEHRNAKEIIDIEVVIGNEMHTALFEDFFEWMGFKRETNRSREKATPLIRLRG